MGGGGGSGPTLQQQQLATEQALTNANLNLEENQQRKTILNAMQGTRVFRGSALSRAVRGNTSQPSNNSGGASSVAQVNGTRIPAVVVNQQSLLGGRSVGAQSPSASSGSTSAGSATRIGPIRLPGQQ